MIGVLASPISAAPYTPCRSSNMRSALNVVLSVPESISVSIHGGERKKDASERAYRRRHSSLKAARSLIMSIAARISVRSPHQDKDCETTRSSGSGRMISPFQRFVRQAVDGPPDHQATRQAAGKTLFHLRRQKHCPPRQTTARR